jgi:menaquinol-cytochrome c reductase iron-sulfur subunit
MTMPANGDTRRSLLSRLTKAVATLVGVCLAAPAVAYVTAPLWRKQAAGGAGPEFSDAGPLADIPVGEWHPVTVEVVRRNGWETSRTRRTAWVRRLADGEQAVCVLSPICPHLGCPINWSPDRDAFVCPCHKGAFDASGSLVSGPPPRRMDALPWEVRSGRLFIRWQDFKIGVATSSPVEV